MTNRAELRTPRLHLWPFQVTDVADAWAYRNDAEFARYLPHIPQPFTLQHAEAFVARNMSESWDQFPTWAIVLDGRLIGTVNFNIKRETRSAMLGYAIGRPWWGLGIAVEAAQAAIAWVSSPPNSTLLVRIWASTDALNVRSQRVLDKLGFKREGVQLSDDLGRNGEPAHDVMYGLNLQ